MELPRPETKRSRVFGKIPDQDRDRWVWSGPDRVPIGLGPNFPNTNEDCLLDEPQFIKLWEQANLTPLAQRTVVHHVVIKRQRQQHMRDTKPDAFIVAATLPPELAYWVGHWACNPAGVPKPI